MLFRPLALDPARLWPKLRRRVRLFARGESPATYFDIRDRDLVNGQFVAADLSPVAPEFAPPDAFVQAEQVYELREDVRRLMPFALTPFQRGAYLKWFLEHGRHEFAIEPVSLLRYLLTLDETPDRGLVASYLVQPAWQERHPLALTPAGWPAFKRWLRDEHGARGRWLRRAKLPANPPACTSGANGVNALGLFRYVSGLQQAGTAVVGSLSLAGMPVACRDIPMPHSRDGRPRRGFDGLEPFDITVLNTGIDMPAAAAYRQAALWPRPGVYRVAVWWWELETVPPGWENRAEGVDEIWAPTRFIAGAMRAFGRPVFPMLPSVVLPDFRPLPKRHFGMDPGRFTFLFVFDMKSLMPRKNPLGLMRAFREAFRPSDAAELVIKVGPQDKAHPEMWRELRAAASVAGVKLIDRMMPREELLGLIHAADAYVSLHRAEGFGLTMAEAMLMGKPTVATAYSGNLDFMSPQNSYLVDHTPAAISEDYPPYPKGAPWAEPSERHAAELMRRVFENRDEARAVGERARAELRDLLSPEVAGRRMAERIELIRRFRR